MLDIQRWISIVVTWKTPMITRVFVLGLLSFQPMSGYAIQHYLRLNRAEQWAAILPGSIHYALKKLEASGLVTLQATEQTGYRTKAIYAITAAGMQEFHRLLEQLWSTPEQHTPVGLYTALTFGREHMEVDLRFLRALREQLPMLPQFRPSLPS